MKRIIILAALLTSCRSAQKHFEIAQRKGLQLDPVTIVTETTRYDTIRDPYTNEIIRVDTLTVRVTETRTEPRFITLTRQERKAMQDSMKHIERKYKDSLKFERQKTRIETKAEVKTERIKARTERKKRPNLWAIGFILLVTGWVLYVIKKKY